MNPLPCKDCASGFLHVGTPLGREEVIAGLNTYIIEPPQPSSTDAAAIRSKGIIIIISDAFGWKLVNMRLVADAYAKRGSYTVYIPDFFDGHYLDYSLLGDIQKVASGAPIMEKIFPGLKALTTFVPFIFFNRPAVTRPRIISFFRHMRSTTSLPIGAAGFCWGGRYVIQLCADDDNDALFPEYADEDIEEDADEDEDDSVAPRGRKPLLDAAFAAHPSNVWLPNEIDAVQLPLSIIVGDQDFALRVESARKIQETFAAREEKGKQEMIILEGAKHGFAIRGDHSSELQIQQELQAQDQALDWFATWLVKKD